MLNRLDLNDWDLFKVITSNRDRNFFANFWFNMFIKFKIKLSYFTDYYSQIDDLFERTNQSIKAIERDAKYCISHENERGFFEFPIPYVRREEIVFPFPFSTITLKIALEYLLSTLIYFNNWSFVIDSMQRDFNNSITVTKKISNEVFYNFTCITNTDLIALTFTSINKTSEIMHSIEQFV